VSVPAIHRPPPALVLATNNQNKVRELSVLLEPWGVPVQSLAEFPRVESVVEEGVTLAENARLKASGYARQIGRWVLADDTGLEVDVLGGAPGIRSARYGGEGATARQNRAKLLAELELVPDGRRTAQFVCHLALADPAGRIAMESRGACRGRILREPVGEGGFGYDALFEIVEWRRTLAELGPVATCVLGHRGRAVRGLTRRALLQWLRAPSA
jgi:XTP/dITP diphosphohydrolase